jgi:CDP-glucose 4,6-dehydratase
MPDLIKAYSSGSKPILRYPNAVRPWQHVLDCLNGYLMISDHLLAGHALRFVNIGPDSENFKTVGEIANLVAKKYSVEPGWLGDGAVNPHEAALLALNANLANITLGWQNKLKFVEAVTWTTDWYKSINLGKSPRDILTVQIGEFTEISQ